MTTAAAADEDRHACGDDAAEHEQQRQRRQWQRDELAPLQVLLREHLDVAVERRSAGQVDLQPGHLPSGASRTGSRASGESSGGRSSATIS